ncbi:major tail protein [Bacillus wiedmannii]|uniref:Phage tail protein n=1 Tax=Bacillus wiedmannii TaxID=1890302 RepID=A0ABX5DKP3_9BACI|nr:major tail protein [Bacillus wiedmannii]PRT35502.1 phage tail protein [Bacillus wiedmannii]
MALVGLKDLHYSKVKTDDKTALVHDEVKNIIGAINASIKPKTSSETLYADDGPADTVSSLGEVEVEFEAQDLPLEVQADILGHTIKSGVLIKNASDIAPYIALGFRALKSTNKYRYIWMLKGRFELVEESYETKGDKVNFQTPKIKGSFIKTDNNGDWQYTGDEDMTDFTADMAKNWFKKVYNPNTSTGASITK